MYRKSIKERWKMNKTDQLETLVLMQDKTIRELVKRLDKQDDYHIEHFKEFTKLNRTLLVLLPLMELKKGIK